MSHVRTCPARDKSGHLLSLSHLVRQALALAQRVCAHHRRHQRRRRCRRRRHNFLFFFTFKILRQIFLSDQCELRQFLLFLVGAALPRAVASAVAAAVMRRTAHTCFQFSGFLTQSSYSTCSSLDFTHRLGPVRRRHGSLVACKSSSRVKVAIV